MKKVLIFVGLIVLLSVVVVLVSLSKAGAVVKTAIQTLGPRITRTSVTVNSVELSPLSGEGIIRGFTLGNPEGYRSPTSIEIAEVHLKLDAKSLRSDKIHILRILVDSPRITIEGGLTDNNLQKILRNIQGFTGSESSGNAGEGSRRKLQVDEFLFRNGKVDVKFGILGGKGPSVNLPEVHLTDLGTQGDGITPGDLSRKIFGSIVS
jgi:hypothetical protein